VPHPATCSISTRGGKSIAGLIQTEDVVAPRDVGVVQPSAYPQERRLA